MGLKELISEERAGALCGLSLAELGGLVEAGKLKVDVDEDGQRYFAKEEILALVNNVKNESFPGAGQNLVIEKIVTSEANGEQDSPAETEGKEEATTASLAKLRELQQLAEDQEKLLDARDTEILRVSREVEWLKNRVAKLDDKRAQERARVLTDTSFIKRAVEKRPSRPSFWQGVLTWLGVVPETEEK